VILSNPFDQEEFLNFIEGFLPDFKLDLRKVDSGSTGFTEVLKLGESASLKTYVLVVRSKKSVNNRISLTTNSFKILKSQLIHRALIVYVNEDETLWRFSLLTALPVFDQGNVLISYSNPKRHSYVLGSDVGIATARKYLLAAGEVKTFDDLQNRFSLEVVNREFYNEIAELYTELVGGSRRKGTRLIEYPGLLKIGDSELSNESRQEFAVRLIGRLVFCWFLREKKSAQGNPLIPDEVIMGKSNQNVYHENLEPLFFELLNKTKDERLKKFSAKPFSEVPYLNGGLFSPKKGTGGDYYKSKKDIAGDGSIEVPDVWLVKFFALLSAYNFTVDENTTFDVEISVDPEMLGRIFENLLAEINPETGESARKSTGSFYTPREIVEYMVDRSLLYYLQNKTGIATNQLRALISYSTLDDLEFPLTDSEKESVAVAISKMKILDPACGSGAFPIGLLQKCIWILERADPKAEIWIMTQFKKLDPQLRKHLERQLKNQNFNYLRKLGVIRDSIYGVDIQPIAVEMSRLRCFLTLIVEEEVDDEFENRGILPLPNLDFKFIAANALIDLTSHKKDKAPGQDMLFDDNSQRDKLMELRESYFSSSLSERSELETEFRGIQEQMSKVIRKGTAGYNSKEYLELAKWNPFEHESSNWFDSNWMFGVDEFDIVLFNPPYLGEKGHKEIFRPISNSNLGQFQAGRMDLFYYFIHLAINITNKGGLVTLISTNYFPTNTGAKKLRRDIYERTNVKELINFNEVKIFESALGQHNMITILEKSDNREPTLIRMATGKSSPNDGGVAKILSGDPEYSVTSYSPHEDLFDNSENLYIRFPSQQSSTDGDFESVLKILASSKFTLKDVCNVNQGFASGAHVFTEKHASKFPKIKANPGDGIFEVLPGEVQDGYKSRNLRPWFKNSDISKWTVELEPRRYVLYLDRQSELNGGDKERLTKFKPILEKRREVLNGVMQWYGLHWPRDEAIFDGPKIVCPQRSTFNKFGYSDGPWYAATDIYLIKERNPKFDLHFILALLNSPLYFVWFYFRGARKGEILELFQVPLSQAPIPDADVSQIEKISKMTKQILVVKNKSPKADISNLEKELNLEIASLFGVRTEIMEKAEELYGRARATEQTELSEEESTEE
jgi:adenine-specific DNA-methyltransferase